MGINSLPYPYWRRWTKRQTTEHLCTAFETYRPMLTAARLRNVRIAQEMKIYEYLHLSAIGEELSWRLDGKEKRPKLSDLESEKVRPILDLLYKSI